DGRVHADATDLELVAGRGIVRRAAGPGRGVPGAHGGVGRVPVRGVRLVRPGGRAARADRGRVDDRAGGAAARVPAQVPDDPRGGAGAGGEGGGGAGWRGAAAGARGGGGGGGPSGPPRAAASARRRPAARAGAAPPARGGGWGTAELMRGDKAFSAECPQRA